MPVKMTINSSLHKKLDTAKAGLAMREAMKETMVDLQRVLQRSPTPKKTGNLRRSINYDVQGSGGTIHGQIKVSKDADYWVYQNFGTSRIPAIHFVEGAVQKVQPKEKLAERFKQKFKVD